MKIYRNLETLPKFRKAVLTIGSYDGVHIGHQQIIRQLLELAKEVDGETVLITFDPHPRLVLYPDDDNLKLLNTIDEKATLLKEYGIDNLIVTPFTRDFSNQSPESYIRNFLVKYFQPSRIVIGYDHKFGKGRAGDISLLRKFEKELNYQVHEIQPQTVKDIAVSSTKIRNAILEGKIPTANGLMGHPFSISGEVVKGKQKGQTIGFPTANIRVRSKHKIIPKDGVYAVNVFIEKDLYQGMLYIGRSMTNTEKSIEVNLFEFEQNIYGKELRIDFHDWIRGDLRFESLTALKDQLRSDKQKATKILDHLLKVKGHE